MKTAIGKQLVRIASYIEKSKTPSRSFVNSKIAEVLRVITAARQEDNEVLWEVWETQDGQNVIRNFERAQKSCSANELEKLLEELKKDIENLIRTVKDDIPESVETTVQEIDWKRGNRIRPNKMDEEEGPDTDRGGFGDDYEAQPTGTVPPPAR